MRDNGLFLVCFGLFLVFLLGMIVSGWHVYNAEQASHGSPPISVLRYLTTGEFVEATFENWESEFLQMGMYVVLTAFLYQKGSSESKPVDGPAPQDADPRAADDMRAAPWPVRRGGPVLFVYQNSLTIAFFALFFASFALHTVGGARAYSDEQQQHGESAAVPGHLAVLVRVDAELAERVHCRGGDRRLVGCPASTRFGRVQAGGRSTSGDRGVIAFTSCRHRENGHATEAPSRDTDRRIDESDV